VLASPCYLKGYQNTEVYCEPKKSIYQKDKDNDNSIDKHEVLAYTKIVFLLVIYRFFFFFLSHLFGPLNVLVLVCIILSSERCFTNLSSYLSHCVRFSLKVQIS